MIRFNSLDNTGMKINRCVYINIDIRDIAIGAAMCEIFINPGNSLSKNKPLLGLDTGIFFLACMKDHDAVLVDMLYEV